MGWSFVLLVSVVRKMSSVDIGATVLLIDSRGLTLAKQCPSCLHGSVVAQDCTMQGYAHHPSPMSVVPDTFSVERV